MPVQACPERDQVTAPLPWVSFCTVKEKICCAPVPNVTVVGETRTEMALTVNGEPLLDRPFTVTTTLPVVAPTGTGTTMPVLLQLVGVAAVPLNVTVLEPCVGPKLLPAMVTGVPTEPVVGERLVMFGGAVTVKRTPLLERAPTVTTILPVVAPLGTGTTMLVSLQLTGGATVPLKRTTLVPWIAPKLVPVIVTGVPIAPEERERLAMFGGITVKPTPLLATPPTVTTTLPVVAPLGTGTMMLVALQLVGIAGALLNVIVLVP